MFIKNNRFQNFVIKFVLCECMYVCPSFCGIAHIRTVLYAFYWVIPRCLNFICRHFGTLCLFPLHRWVGVKND